MFKSTTFLVSHIEDKQLQAHRPTKQNSHLGLNHFSHKHNP